MDAYLTNVDSIDFVGFGWRLSIAKEGNECNIFFATEMFANNINSSIIEFVSYILYAPSSVGAFLLLSSFLNLNFGCNEDRESAPSSIRCFFKIFDTISKFLNDLAMSDPFCLSSIIF